MRPWTRKQSLGGVKFRTTIEPHEARVLAGLVGSVVTMLDGRESDTPQDELAALTGIRSGHSAPPDDPILARLLPDFHRADADPETAEHDPEAAEVLNAGLRTLYENEVLDAKRRSARELLATLPGEGGKVALTPEQADAWISALTDVRLALGTALGVDGKDPDELDPDDPRAGDMDVYHWLTWVQDSLLQAVLR